MVKSFCPKCGKDADVFYENVCMECFLGNITLLICPDVLYSRICPSCGSVYKKGKWLSREDEAETIIEMVKESLKPDRQAKNLELKLSPKQIDYSRYNIHVDATAEIKGVPAVASIDTQMRINWETCDTCSRISGGYFEGIVQIRADNRLPSKEELKRCSLIAEEVAARSREKGERLAFISKAVDLEEGIDFYVGVMKLGKQICKAIIEVFGGKFTESPKLVGQKNGVDLYRITFAMRLPEFVRGDIISVDDTVIEVQSCGKHVSGIELVSGKRYIENFDNLMGVKKLSRRSDAVLAILIADEGKTIQMMDPDTYETVTIKRPEFLKAEPGNEIKVVKTSKGMFVVP